jgi:hydrogenase nickel incorporation protein HypB
MCTVCGCNEGNVEIEKHEHSHTHPHDEHSHTHPHDEHSHTHPHDEPSHTHPFDEHSHSYKQEHDHLADHVTSELLHYGHGLAHAHVPGFSQARLVQIEQNILGKNDLYAQENRKILIRDSILSLNLVSSPGSGKTTLLTTTLKQLKKQIPLAVIEGDQQTTNDADRIRATGVPAIQVNTGKGCHLDALMVGQAIEQLKLTKQSILFIENVGNLVCPAAFDLGEAHKVAILSVTEGEDKPLKYPDMFAAADLMLLNKTDLLPYLSFDVDRCLEYARQVNPKIEIIELSGQSGVGVELWLDWLLKKRQHMIQRQVATIEKQLQQLKQQLD